MAKRLMDISQPMLDGMPGWPGDTPYETTPVWQHGPDCPVAVARIRCSTHCGTHADAPLHYDPAGAAIDALSLEAYVGRARVLDLRHAGPVVMPEHVRPAVDGTVERVLLRTWARFAHEAWDERFACVSPQTIELLAEHGVILIGTDAPSIDPQASKTLDAHRAVRAADMRILEGLMLDAVEAGDYELIALPLRLAGLDAAPVRAVLRCL